MYVRPARTCSNGCKSLNRPDSGKVTAKDKGKESHTMWHQAILGKNLRQQQQGIWANAEPHVRWCERSENESRKKTTSFSSYFRFPRRSFFSVLSDPTVTSYHFVLRKRFKRYERAVKTCFVREKRFRWNGSRLPDGAQAVGDTFQSFIQKLARTCQVDADEAFSRFAVH